MSLLDKYTVATLSSILVRTFSFSEVPSIPSVSSTSACREGSKAAHTPEVQLVCWALVGNTSSPQKKVWFNVCDFPSPVLPRIATTFVTAEESQPSLAQSSEGELMESCSVWSISKMDWMSSTLPVTCSVWLAGASQEMPQAPWMTRLPYSRVQCRKECPTSF